MQSIQANTHDYDNFNFSMQTSSGDKIDLRLYDEKSSELSFSKDGNSTSLILSLTHSYGYSFRYEGNGIDTQDKKEIDQAMKTIQPMLEKYMQNVKDSEENFSMSEITNRAFDINHYLPKTQNHDTKSYLQDQTLKSIDKILEKAQYQNQKLLEHAQKLFESIMKQTDRFELYM